MNKEQLLEILQAVLLAFDGVPEKDLNKKYGLNPKLSKIGFKLSHYLKSKEVGDL